MFAMSAVVTVRQPVWSPIDEGLHWATADIYLHGRVPEIQGQYVFPQGLPGGTTGVDYQAAEPPLNYFLLAAVEAGVDALAPVLNGVLGKQRTANRISVHVDRLLSSLLLALMVPLLWLAARVVAPGSLAFAWGMPGALFVFRGIIIDGSRVSNDLLVSLLATLAIYMVMRRRESLTVRHGLLVGLVIGLATLAKYQGVFAFIPIGLLLLVRLPRDRFARLGRTVAYLVGAVAVWLVLVTPWFVFQYTRYGEPTGGSAERKVLPPEVLLPANPWPVILASPSHLFLSATFAEVANPLNAHYADLNVAIAWALPWLLLVGVISLPIAAAVGGLGRLERIAIGVSAPLMFVLLVAISIKAGIVVIHDARDEVPAALPFTLLIASPLLLVPRRLDRPAAAALLLVVSALAIFSTLLLSLVW